MIEIRQANKSEIDTAFLLLKESALWLKSKNIDYWQNWLNPPEIHINWIKDGFNLNEFHFVEDEKNIVGMFRLQFEDEMFWGKRNDNSSYLHSFTIKSDRHGKNLGREIISEIEILCMKNKNNFLRLDCGTDVRKLCSYYESCGFAAVGEVTVHNENLKLYEKKMKHME